MRKPIHIFVMVWVMLFGILIKAEEGNSLGSICRQIAVAGENKYKTFLLDEFVYKYAKEDLSDLRIVNADGIHMPYYIEEGSSENKSLQLQKKPSYTIQNKERSTIIQVKNDSYLKINAFILEAEGIFKRRYTVTGINEEGESFYLWSGEVYSLDFKSTNVENRTIYLSEYTRYPEVNIRIENEDDQPLKITGFKMNYWIDKVVFAADGHEPYELWYGSEEAVKPRYDIEAFKKYIKKESQDMCVLKEPQKQKAESSETKKPKDFQTVFNGLLIGSAGILILIVFRKLKQS